MARTAPRVELTETETTQLRALLRRSSAPLRSVVRARILLSAAHGQENQAIATTLKLRPATVGKVRQRFATQRLGALEDAPRSGRKRKYGPATQQRILAAPGRAQTQRGMRGGTGRSWPRIWAMSPTITSGGCCATGASVSSAAARGASPPTRSLIARPPTSWPSRETLI